MRQALEEGNAQCMIDGVLLDDTNDYNNNEYGLLQDSQQLDLMQQAPDNDMTLDEHDYDQNYDKYDNLED